jgi:hypothetical protein
MSGELECKRTLAYANKYLPDELLDGIKHIGNGMLEIAPHVSDENVIGLAMKMKGNARYMDGIAVVSRIAYGCLLVEYVARHPELDGDYRAAAVDMGIITQDDRPGLDEAHIAGTTAAVFSPDEIELRLPWRFYDRASRYFCNMEHDFCAAFRAKRVEIMRWAADQPTLPRMVDFEKALSVAFNTLRGKPLDATKPSKSGLARDYIRVMGLKRGLDEGRWTEDEVKAKYQCTRKDIVEHLQAYENDAINRGLLPVELEDAAPPWWMPPSVIETGEVIDAAPVEPLDESEYEEPEL